jgi:hypothetical protein
MKVKNNLSMLQIPTNMELSVTLKIGDIIISGCLISGVAFCYLFEHLTSPKF